MNRLVPVVMLVCMTVSYLPAQPPATLWTKALGGTNIERATSVVQTHDGGFAAIGHTYSFGPTPANLWLIRMNAQGDTLWTRIFDGGGNAVSRSIKQTPDRGFILFGYVFSSPTSFDLWIIKTDSLGGVMWSKIYGTVDSEMAGSVDMTTDGGCVFVSTRTIVTASDIWLFKTNATGDTLWSRILGGSLSERAYSVRQTTDGGFILTGDIATAAASGDVLLIKTDSLGLPVWTRMYGGSLYDGGSHVEQTLDGGYIITGTTTPNLNNNDLYLIKTMANGNVVWTKTYGVPAPASDGGNCVQQTADSGYIVVGSTLISANFDLWLLKMNQNGDTTWSRRIGGGQHDVGSFVRQTTDRGYIVAGYTVSFGAGGSEDAWLLRFAGPPSRVGGGPSGIPNKFALHQNYPNPFNPATEITFEIGEYGWVTLTVYDLLGREVATLVNEAMKAGDYTATFDASLLSSGVYFYRLHSGSRVQTMKALLLR